MGVVHVGSYSRMSPGATSKSGAWQGSEARHERRRGPLSAMSSFDGLPPETRAALEQATMRYGSSGGLGRDAPLAASTSRVEPLLLRSQWAPLLRPSRAVEQASARRHGLGSPALVGAGNGPVSAAPQAARRGAGILPFPRGPKRVVSLLHVQAPR